MPLSNRPSFRKGVRVPIARTKKSLKIKCSGRMFLGHQGPIRRDLPDPGPGMSQTKNFMQGAFFCGTPRDQKNLMQETLGRLVSPGEGFGVGFRGVVGGGFPVENEGKGERGGRVGLGQSKEPASQHARVCQNYPLANYP